MTVGPIHPHNFQSFCQHGVPPSAKYHSTVWDTLGHDATSLPSSQKVSKLLQEQSMPLSPFAASHTTHTFTRALATALFYSVLHYPVCVTCNPRFVGIISPLRMSAVFTPCPCTFPLSCHPCHDCPCSFLFSDLFISFHTRIHYL